MAAFDRVRLGIIRGRGGEPDPVLFPESVEQVGDELSSSIAVNSLRNPISADDLRLQLVDGGEGGGVGYGEGLQPPGEDVFDR